jgi:hypothetical protein
VWPSGLGALSSLADSPAPGPWSWGGRVLSNGESDLADMVSSLAALVLPHGVAGRWGWVACPRCV